MRDTKVRMLSEKGIERFGKIFTDGYVPVKEITPVMASLDGHGDPQRVFMVDWGWLQHLHKDLIVEYMAQEFVADPEDVRRNFVVNGQFPIRAEFVVESYDIRYFV